LFGGEKKGCMVGRTEGEAKYENSKQPNKLKRAGERPRSHKRSTQGKIPGRPKKGSLNLLKIMVEKARLPGQ